MNVCRRGGLEGLIQERLDSAVERQIIPLLKLLLNLWPSLIFLVLEKQELKAFREKPHRFANKSITDNR